MSCFPFSPGPAACSSSVSSAELPPGPSRWTPSHTAPGSWSRTTEAKLIHPEEEKEKSRSNYQQGTVQFDRKRVTTSQAWTLLLSPVLRMGPCRGPGPGRNCTGGRWPLAVCRSYRGHGTEPPPRTLPRPPDAGGLSSACSPGSSRWCPATEPERTHEEDSWRLPNSAAF